MFTKFQGFFLIGIIEEELVYVKYVKAGKPTTTFLSIQAPMHSNAVGVKGAVEAAFNCVGNANWKQKKASAGTDGASVNIGRVGGLIALLKQDIPWLKGIWCVAHHLELGILDSIKHEKFLADIKELLQGVYKQYHYSPKAISLRELKEVAVALEVKMIMPVNI